MRADTGARRFENFLSLFMRESGISQILQDVSHGWLRAILTTNITANLQMFVYGHAQDIGRHVQVSTDLWCRQLREIMNGSYPGAL